MARLLYRSKSSKELNTKYELPGDDLPRSSVQFPPHTPNKLTRRRTGTLTEPKCLTRSKSIGDVKVPLRQRMDLASPFLPEQSLSAGASKRPAVPPTREPYMEHLLPRNSSRASLNSNLSAAGIGVAIGTPTKEGHMYIGVRGSPPKNNGYPVSTSIPSFYLPPEPFDINGDTDSTRKYNNGLSGDQQQQARGGWRKLFGRSLFGSKKSPAPVPHVPVLEALLQPRHMPLVTAAAAKPTPTVNKLRKEEPKERKTVDKEAKKESSPQLLNVEIPTVEMDRYSIMFRGLLRDDSPTKSKPAEKMSLYDRRRSKDALSGGNSKERPRLQLEPLKRHATIGGRATPTSNMTDCPIPFSVSTKSDKVPKYNVRLGRSNTIGAHSRDLRPGPGFALAGTASNTGTITSGGIQQERTNSASIPRNLGTPKAARNSLSGRSIALSVDGSFEEGDDRWFQEQMPRSAFPRTAEGKKISKSPGISSKYSSPSNQSTSRQSSQKQASSKQSQLPPRTEEELMRAAQRSIERQISLSQRQLLTPVVLERAKAAREQAPSESTSTINISE